MLNYLYGAAVLTGVTREVQPGGKGTKSEGGNSLLGRGSKVCECSEIHSSPFCLAFKLGYTQFSCSRWGEVSIHLFLLCEGILPPP